MPDLAVGSLQQSLLSEAQFQAVMGTTDWVLANGQGAVGSTYASITGNSNVPDLRGKFLRMTGGDASGLGLSQDSACNPTGVIASVEVGGTSVDVGGAPVTVSGNKNQFNYTDYASLSTTMNLGRHNIQAGSYNTTFLSPAGTSGSTSYNLQGTSSSHRHSLSYSGTFSASGTVGSKTVNTATDTRSVVFSGDNETRPVNIAVNYFIKIN